MFYNVIYRHLLLDLKLSDVQTYNRYWILRWESGDNFKLNLLTLYIIKYT